MGASGRNESYWIVSEWLTIKQLAEMGITVNASELPEELLEAFGMLSNELRRLENEALRKQARASKRGSRGR